MIVDELFADDLGLAGKSFLSWERAAGIGDATRVAGGDGVLADDTAGARHIPWELRRPRRTSEDPKEDHP